MIELQFEHLDKQTCKLDDFTNCTQQLHNYAFFGTQIFIVNGAIFTGEYPILGFARQLRRVVYEYEQGLDSAWILSPDMTAPSLKFTLLDGQPLISDGDQQARVELSELGVKASDYLDYVVAKLSVYVPELKTNKVIKNWLERLQYPGQNHHEFITP